MDSPEIGMLIEIVVGSSTVPVYLEKSMIGRTSWAGHQKDPNRATWDRDYTRSDPVRALGTNSYQSVTYAAHWMQYTPNVVPKVGDSFVIGAHVPGAQHLTINPDL